MSSNLPGDPLRLSQVEPVMIQMLSPGDKVRLADGSLCEVISNPKDGLWLMVTFLEAPEDPSLVGTEDMVFANDVLGQVKEA